MKKIAIALLLFAPSLSFSYTLTEVVSNMEAREKEISSMRFKYEQKVVFTAMETATTVHGQAHFAKGGRFRIEKEKPDRQLIVSDGKTLSVYNPSFNQMWRGPWKGWLKASLLPKGFVPMNDFVSDLRKNFELELVGPNAAGGRVGLRATPKDAAAGYRLELGVSAAEWIVEEIKFVSETARVQTFFTRIEINPPTEASLFSMTIPKGAEVIPLN